MTTFSYFISAHGFGHAARASAVMAAIQQARPGTRFEIYTMAPPWFFGASLNGPFAVHPARTDIGLVQPGPFEEDLAGTVRELSSYIPFQPAEVERLAAEVRAAGCQAVLCDIAPLGIAVAAAAGIPSVLIENFTWDWIYNGYTQEEPGLLPFMPLLDQAFRAATYRVRTVPYCQVEPPADLVTTVVARWPKRTRAEIRAEMGIHADRPAVLVTMGGIYASPRHMDSLRQLEDVYFIIPGASPDLRVDGNLVLFAHHSQFYHPDIVHSVDAVVGKLGYSTLGETYHAGIPYGYLTRSRFVESPCLGQFVDEHMPGFHVTDEQFASGAWIDRVPDLLALPHVDRGGELNGAVQIAEFVLSRVS